MGHGAYGFESDYDTHVVINLYARGCTYARGDPTLIGDRSTPEQVLLLDTDLLDERVTYQRRIEIWNSAGLVPTLTMVAKQLSLIDLAVVQNAVDEAEMKWAYALDGQFGRDVRDAIHRDAHVLSLYGLMQCLREIVEYCDVESTRRLPAADLATCLLGINADVDNLSVGTPSNWQELQDDLVLHSLASQSFSHLDTMHTLSIDAHEIWRRKWPADTPAGVLVDLAASPVELFRDLYGFNQDDFFYFGWVVYSWINAQKKVVVDRELMAKMGVPGNVFETTLAIACQPIDALREAIREGRGDQQINLWSHHLFQRFPLVELPDGRILVLRLQYLLQRFFGRPHYFDFLVPLKASEPLRAKHFEGAIAHVFETRCKELLERIVGFPQPGGGGGLITNVQMEDVWNTSSSQASTCDFAYVRDGVCVLIDANYRALMQPFAEGVGNIEAFNRDLRTKYKKKFVQLLTTVRHFQRSGWDAGGIVVDNGTKFIPIVLAPDDGLPSNELIEHLLLEIGAPMVSDLPNTLPPTVITWRDMLLIESMAEKQGIAMTELLARWRLHAPTNQTLSPSFQVFLETATPLKQYYSEHHRNVGGDFSSILMERLLDAQLVDLPPQRRQAMKQSFWKQMRQEAGYST